MMVLNSVQKWLSESVVGYHILSKALPALGLLPLLGLIVVWHSALPCEPLAQPQAELLSFERGWGSGALIPELALSTQWWRLWSAPLAHSSWTHLCSNMLILILTTITAIKTLNWGGLKRGLWVSLFVYQSAVVCYLIRALTAGGWSAGISGGVLALVGVVSVHLFQEKSPHKWVWCVFCLYLLTPREGGFDQLVHLLGFAIGAAWAALTVKGWSWHMGYPKRLLYALLITHLVALTVAFQTLRAPDSLWADWRVYAHISELNGPAIGNGLCFLGPVTTDRVHELPWTLKGSVRSLDRARSLSIKPINEQMAVAIIHNRTYDPHETLGVVCLSPLHAWPLNKRRQRWLREALNQIDRARALISP